MPAINDKDVHYVTAPKLGFWDKLYVPAIIEGLGITGRHVVDPNSRMTELYPEEEPTLPLNYRGVHRLNRDEKGRVQCVACYMCSTACPAHCIDIVAAPAPADWGKDGREKYPETFVIDELRCIYCGMCEEACPVDAIELTSLYDLTGLSREQMVFDKEKLLAVHDATVDGGPYGGRDPRKTRPGKLGPAAELPMAADAAKK